MDQIIDFLEKNGGELLTKMWEHLYISLIAVLLGIIVAVPLGVVLTRMKRRRRLCHRCREYLSNTP